MTAQTILPANTLSSGGYQVDHSLRFNSGSSDSLEKTFSSAGNRRTFTMSCWVKRSSFNSHQRFFGWKNNGGGYGLIWENTDGPDQLRTYIVASGSNAGFLTNRKFRDPAAWYHIVLKIDTTQGTEANRMRLYINGVEETSFESRTYPNQNEETHLNLANKCFIGQNPAGDNSYLNGYLCEVVFIDGTALDADSFGEFDSDSGVWKPIDVSGLTFGQNGFYLESKGVSTGQNSNGLGADTSGNDHHFATSGFSAIDQSTDTCTNNFATWNALFRKGTTTPAFTEGNLKSTFDDGGANEFALTTFGVSAGKWYAEVKWTSNTGTAATATGILDMAYSGTADPNDSVTNAFGYFGSGTKNVSGTASSYGNSYADGDIIGIAIDMDNNKLYFSKNGTFQNSGDPTTGSTGTGAIGIVAGVTYGIFATDYNNQVAELNTGSPPFAISSGNTDGNGYGNFEYAVPSGYYSLNTKNLSEYG